MTHGPPSLRIAAMLPPPLQMRLLAAVEQLPETIVCLLPVPHGLSLLQDKISLVVVDPMTGGPALVANVCQLLNRGPPWPLLIYTAITTASAHVLAALSRQGLREIILTPYEDSPERLAHTLRRVATTTRHLPLLDVHA